MAVLASGQGTNLQAIVDASRSGVLQAQVVLVASDRAEAPALHWASQAGLPIHVTRDEEDLIRVIENAGATLVCLAGYMRLLGRVFVRHFQHRVINIHPSLLPAFPGRHGVRDALAAGVRVSGCTVHLVDEGVDTGPILAQAAVPVFEDDTEATLHARIQREEHRLYPQVLQSVCQGRYVIIGRQAWIPGGPA